MRSRLALIATGAVLAMIATGCSSTPPSTEGNTGGLSGSLEVQTNLAADSALMTSLKEVTDGFTKDNPDVKIDLVPATTTYENDMKVRLAAGNPPDIWHTHGWSLIRYSKFLMPLQDEPWAKNLNPALDTAMVGSDGAFYAMPIDTDVSGILYNKDVLDKAGVKVEDITSWDDFMSAAKKVKANGTSPIYVSEKANGPAGNFVDWLAPGAFTKDDEASMAKGTFVNDKYQDVLDMVAQFKSAGLFNPDYVSATAEDMSKALAQGNAAFIFTQNYIATSAFTFNPKANIGYFPIPAIGGDPSYFVGGEQDAYGISKTTKSPKAAKAYIAYLAQPANESKLASAAGSAPGLTDAKSDLAGLQSSYDDFVVKQKTPVAPYFDRVSLPNGMWNTLVATTDSVITGQSSVASALAKVESEFKGLYGQSK
jgi:raffinose/stachyose/melibiose transport system substrate-binding protein